MVVKWLNLGGTGDEATVAFPVIIHGEFAAVFGPQGGGVVAKEGGFPICGTDQECPTDLQEEDSATE